MRIATSGISWTRVQTPRRLSTAFKALYVVLTMGSAIAGALALFPAMGAFSAFGLLVWGLLVASFVLSQKSAWVQGVVDVTDTALLVHPVGGRERVVDRASIVGALVVERPIPGAVMHTVELELVGGDRLTIATSDAETASALVDRLGFGRGGARIRSRVTTPGRRFIHLAIAVGAYVLVTMPMTMLEIWADGELARTAFAIASPLVLLAVYTLVRWLASPPEVVIGNDGVRVERGYGSRFFRVNDPALWSALRGFGIDDLRVASILRRAEERANVPAPGEPSAFARGDRSLDDWRRALAAMFEGGYRDSPKTAEEAARVVASAAAAPEQRLGAAMALRVAGETERVRVAAAATADERVRIALEAVADDEGDAIIEKALRKMSVR